ncbi:MAG: alanine racemase [Rhodospirillales bacterium]|nr:alanine racemase [Rhodospirillales bacterium]
MAAGDASAAAPSVLTVDLRAIAANYRLLRARLGGGAECAGVLKANAYGLGAARVGPVLAQAGCRHFFVAHLGEGLELRPLLPPQAAIYVLNGLASGEEDAFIDARLVPVLNDPGQIGLWLAAARLSSTALPAVIHIDTGMSRLGLSPAEARHLAGERARLNALDLRFLMSHLACADEPGHDLNLAQHREFAGHLAAWPGAKASFANSSAIFLGSTYHFDLVRPGCALYGINPTPGGPNPVAGVARLEAKVLQIRDVDPPRSVGYGATHRVTGRTRIATIAVGYADGWLRTLSNRGCAFYGAVRLPVIGRVSMDLITLDVTSAPAIGPGDIVELMGPHLAVDAVADIAGTNGYEVLTRLGRRFRRVYLDEPQAPA